MVDAAPAPAPAPAPANEVRIPAAVPREAMAELMRRSLKLFIEEAWHVLEPATPLEPNWHIGVIADHVQALLEDWIRTQIAARGRIAADELAVHQEARRLKLPIVDGRVADLVHQRIHNLLINVPPGTAKSRIISVMMPAWMWTRWPSWKAIFLSVNPRVALRDSVFCRELLRSRWYQETFRPEWRLADDQDAKGLYKNTGGGWRMALGYRAQIVGDRGDALIPDDPNDPEEVHSEVNRVAVNQRWDDVLKNRVNDLRTSVRCIIQQRVHVEDLSGHVLTEEPELWEHVRIPMEREADESGCNCPSCARGHTALGWTDARAPGELLFPRRFPPAVLESFRRKSYLWTSQYQQRPVPAAGNMFKPEWWRFWRHAWEPDVPGLEARTVVLPERFEWTALSWDCAFKKTADSDRVAGGAWSGVGSLYYLRDLVWDRLSFTETVARLETQAEKFPDAFEVAVEDKANGDAVIDTLKHKVRGLVPVSPEGGKEARAAATSPIVEAGQVFLPLHAGWRDQYIAEHTAFPRGANDDAVDQQSQILLRRANRPRFTAVQPRGRYGGRRM